MRGYAGGRVSARRTVNARALRLHALPIAVALRRGILPPNHPPPHQVKTILPVMSGNDVRERERLHRKPQSAELLAQRLQALQLVSEYPGTLVFQRNARRLHGRA